MLIEWEWAHPKVIKVVNVPNSPSRREGVGRLKMMKPQRRIVKTDDVKQEIYVS